MKHGVPTVCVPNGVGQCVKPFLDRNGADDSGGAHGPLAGKLDVNGGRMDGFIRVSDSGRIRRCRRHPHGSDCAHLLHPNVMSYHDGSQLPNYWAYARNFVLQDHMFEPNWGWSLPAHLWLVSGWSAQCRNPYRASTCTTNLSNRNGGPAAPLRRYRHGPLYGWTDLTYLLHEYGITWASYEQKGKAPDCLGGPIGCYTRLKGGTAPRMWNPLPDFTDVHQDHQSAVAREPLGRFYAAAQHGDLPNVSWVTPDWADSNHPGAPIGQGQAWVTKLVNAVMAGPDWKSTAIFLAWDDWGGFYDHVKPPVVDSSGYGLRVPGARDQRLREARLRRPPGSELRRLPQVHRGRLPRRPPHRPENRRAARPPSRRSRERADPRQPAQGLRLRPEAATPAAAGPASLISVTRTGGSAPGTNPGRRSPP